MTIRKCDRCGKEICKGTVLFMLPKVVVIGFDRSDFELCQKCNKDVCDYIFNYKNENPQ